MAELHRTCLLPRPRPSGGGLRLAAALAAAALGLASCVPLQQLQQLRPLGAAPDGAGPSPAAAAGDAQAPIKTEKLAAPVALAPEMTARPGEVAIKPVYELKGTAKPPPAPPLIVAPPPPAAGTASAPAATATAASCPAGDIGMWSKDVIGSAVFICRSPNPRP